MTKDGREFAAIHAEIDCIRRFPYSPSMLQLYTMWNTRIDRNGIIKMAKPCKFCQDVLDNFGIQCCYTNNQGLFEEV